MHVGTCLPAGSYRLHVVQTDSHYACAAIWESPGSWIESRPALLCEIAPISDPVRQLASRITSPPELGLQHLDVELADASCHIVVKVLLPQSAWDGEAPYPRVVLRTRTTIEIPH